MGPWLPKYPVVLVFIDEVDGLFIHEVYWDDVGSSDPVMSGNRAIAFAGWSMKGLLESSGGGEP